MSQRAVKRAMASVPIAGKVQVLPATDGAAVVVASGVVAQSESSTDLTVCAASDNGGTVVASSVASEVAPPVSPVIAPRDNSAPVPVGVPANVVISPASPGQNRNRFMANCQPLQVCCDLNMIGVHNPATRFSFQAIVLVVYPANKSPERRHVQLIDSRGSAGITIWGEHIHMFTSSSVGQVIKFTKLSLVMNNGKKMLSMGRDSTVNFLNTIAVPTEESKWWRSLLQKRPLSIIDVHDCTDDDIINVAGIVGLLSTETKKVKDQNRDLLCIRLTDRTGFVDVRSWTHCEAEFVNFMEHPLLLNRVRVTSYAGVKILELLDGSGTQLVDQFDGALDLKQYWQE